MFNDTLSITIGIAFAVLVVVCLGAILVAYEIQERR